MAYLEADVKEIYIELPEDYHESRDQVCLLREVMYDLVHAGLLWSKTIRQRARKKGVRTITRRRVRILVSSSRKGCHHRGVRG